MDGIEGLAASIAVHGLRKNLNVAPREDGRGFDVVAGGRRNRALKQLAKTGQLAGNAPIPCRVLAEGDDPAEISLVENAMREAMHPDQCAAFSALIDKGSTVEDIAARFGITPAIVRQRLKLAGVSPSLHCLYRKGEMTLDHMMALAISDDHTAQEAPLSATCSMRRTRAISPMRRSCSVSQRRRWRRLCRNPRRVLEMGRGPALPRLHHLLWPRLAARERQRGRGRERGRLRPRRHRPGRGADHS